MSESLDFRYELYRAMYQREHERRMRIESGMALPAGALSLILGGGTYYVASLRPFSASVGTVLFLVPVAALFVVACISAVYVYRTLHSGAKYSYPPTAREIDEYVRRVRHYASQKGENLSDEDIENELKSRLLVSYREAATDNALNNDAKAGYRTRAYSSLIVALGFLLLSGFVLTVRQLPTHQVHDVRIVQETSLPP